MNIEGKKFTLEKIVVDGNHYKDCKFFGCKILYAGGELPLFESPEFIECEFGLDGPAWQTIAYLKSLYAHVLTRPIVETWLGQIRKSAGAEDSLN